MGASLREPHSYEMTRLTDGGRGDTAALTVALHTPYVFFCTRVCVVSVDKDINVRQEGVPELGRVLVEDGMQLGTLWKTSDD